MILLTLLLAVSAAAAPGSDADFAASLGRIQQDARFIRTTQESGPNDPLLVMQRWRIELIKKTRPSVVGLLTPMPGAGPKGETGMGFCTGFFVKPKALGRVVIATNAHCVEQVEPGSLTKVGLHEDKDRVEVVDGRVLAHGNSSVAKDIAFVELADPSRNRPPLPLWEKLEVGEAVVAIGHPKGMMFSVSQGIVSAVEREQIAGQLVLDYAQSDVAVNEGNSGGPLLNAWGSVVGINSQIYSEGGGFMGMSFSLPSRYIEEAALQYKRTGNLGVGALEAATGADRKNGRLILGPVKKDGAADKAGLKPGDQYLSVDGLDLTGDPQDAVKTLFLHVKYRSPGEKVTVKVKRGGRQLSFVVTLGGVKD